MQTMHYSFLLRALKNGDYTIKPAAVKYWARGEEKESTAASGEITFKAVRFALVENNTTRIFIICVALLAVAVAGMGFVVVRRKKARRQKQATGGGTGADKQAAELLQICRQSKLRGDYAGFFKQLSTLRAWLPRRTVRLPATLPPCLKKCSSAGFGLRPKKLSACCGSLKKARGKFCPGTKKTSPTTRNTASKTLCDWLD